MLPQTPCWWGKDSQDLRPRYRSFGPQTANPVDPLALFLLRPTRWVLGFGLASRHPVSIADNSSRYYSVTDLHEMCSITKQTVCHGHNTILRQRSLRADFTTNKTCLHYKRRKRIGLRMSLKRITDKGQRC